MQKLIIEGNLPDLNTYTNANRTNRYAGSSVKKRATELVALYCSAQLSGKFEKVRLKIKWYEKNDKKDPDNVVFAKKFILDGMVKSGFIKNDGRKNVLGFEEEVLTDKNNPRIEVYIDTYE